MNQSEIEQALEHCEFFERLEKSDISKIAGLCQVNTYEGGEYVFQQGDYGEYIYVVVQGRLHLVRDVDLGARKGEVVIEALGQGQGAGLLVNAAGSAPHPHVLGCLSKADNDPGNKGS